jgi:hypothetical protein
MAQAALLSLALPQQAKYSAYPPEAQLHTPVLLKATSFLTWQPKDYSHSTLPDCVKTDHV